MKKPYRLFFIVTICIINFRDIIAQSKLAGLDQSPLIWITRDSSSLALGKFINKGVDTTSLIASPATSELTNFNFHPTFLFGPGSSVSLPVNPNNLSVATIFTVYQPADTRSEYIIWHFKKDDSAKTILTTSRLSDLSSFDYMNFKDKMPANPKLNIYMQGKSADSIVPSRTIWQIGSRPFRPSLPVKEFKGMIPEILVYNQLLNTEQRLKVSSYLALKYGITLSDPSWTYVNSQGDVIWKGNDLANFHNNIAGIGRDDTNGFLQKISSSGNLPGLMTLSTKDSLFNLSYLIWGDNGLPLRLGPTNVGQPSVLQKNWLLSSTGTNKPFLTAIDIDGNQLDIKMEPNPIFWLGINENASEKPTVAGTRYYKMDKIDASGHILFGNILLGTALGKQTLFLIPGRDILLSSLVYPARCQPLTQGRIETNIFGGRPPFNIYVYDRTGSRQMFLTSDGLSPVEISNLKAGYYLIRVSDQNGKSTIDSVQIVNEDGPVPSQIETIKDIPRGSYIDLDASRGQPGGIDYAWSGPDGFVSTVAAIHVSDPGLYELMMSKSGCSNQQRLRITTKPENIFDNRIKIYPNPSTGNFTADVSLDQPATVSMLVYDTKGQLLSTDKKTGMANYRFGKQLYAAGTYRLMFISGQYSASKQLIVAK